MRRKNNDFWQIHLGLGHLSCSFSIFPLLFTSHHAEFDIDEHWLFLHSPLLLKSSPLVIYLGKICHFSQLQILQVPLIILTSFLILGLTFSN